MPFSQAFLAALRMGYTRRDLAVMPYGEVVFDLAAMNEDGQGRQEQEGASGGAARRATQEDIRTMLG